MKLIPTFALVLGVAAFGAGSALAQSGQFSAPTSHEATGSTTGPASPSGQSTTLGSNGQTAATPHQAESIQNFNKHVPTANAQGSGAQTGAGLGQKPAQQ